MKVAIIGFANLRLIPYFYTYKNILDEAKIKYDVIYWDRKCENEIIENAKTYPINIEIDDTWFILKKLFLMIKFSYRVKKILKENQYDKLIILTTLPAVLLYKILISKFKGKYIFDNRDFSYENIKIFKHIEGKIMRNSLLNIISSSAFRTFIPDYPTTICHNCNFTDVGIEKFKKSKEKLVLSFIGMIRYEEECKKVLDVIKNDARIEFRFYGEGEGVDPLKLYCKKNHIENVLFYGKYLPNEKADIIRATDIIYNCYGNKDNEVKYALSNKLYDALYFKKPLLVNNNTTMEEASKGFSFIFNENDVVHFTNKLIEWYECLDVEQFDEICNEKLKSVLIENQKFKKEVLSGLLR